MQEALTLWHRLWKKVLRSSLAPPKVIIDKLRNKQLLGVEIDIWVGFRQVQILKNKI